MCNYKSISSSYVIVPLNKDNKVSLCSVWVNIFLDLSFDKFEVDKENISFVVSF